MKSFQNILLTLLALMISFFLGFWIRDHQLFEDTDVGEKIYSLSQAISPNLVKNPESSQTSNRSFLKNKQEDVDYDLSQIEQLIFEDINQLRQEKGLTPVQNNQTLQSAARLRAQESAEIFSHTRPNGQGPFTVLEEEYKYPYSLAGENLGMATLAEDEAYMANWLFQGWLDSPDHYETMVNPDFSELGVGAYIHEGALCVAHMFARPL